METLAVNLQPFFATDEEFSLCVRKIQRYASSEKVQESLR